MIEIIVNKQTRSIDPEAKLSEIIATLELQHDCYAIAVNRKIITRDLFSMIQLQAGDEIEVVVPMQGG